MLAGLEIGEFRFPIVQKHYVVIAACAARSAPLGARIGHEAAVRGDRMNQFDRTLPFLRGDIEVVMRKGQDIQTTYIATVGEVVARGIGAAYLLLRSACALRRRDRHKYHELKYHIR